MRKKLSLIKLAILVVFVSFIHVQNSSAAFNPGSSRPLPREDFVKGQILVKFKPSAPHGLINNIHAAERATKVTEFAFANLHLVRLKQGQSVKSAVQNYSQNPNVIYAEPDYIYSIDSVTPNDPQYNKLWGLHNSGQTVNGSGGINDADMDVPEAWDMTTGSSSVVVGVLDSGVAWNHEDLATNIWSNNNETVNGTDSDSNGKVDDIRGWDFIDNDNDPYDLNSHGTHVSGTIAAVGNNSKGVAGVNWTAKIMPLRVCDANGSCPSSAQIAGIEYAVANGAHIINASLGGTGYSQAMKDAIEAAGDAGILFVAAAGNDGTNNDGGIHHYPSDFNLANIISVAATDPNDALASFSNYGSTSVDVGAPGVNTYSTVPSSISVWSDDFGDANISNWTTGGTGTGWGITGTVGLFSPFSLTDSVASNYQNNSNTWASTPALNLTGLSGCALNYPLVSLLETGSDFLYIEASTDGVNFSIIQTISFFDTQYWYLVSTPMGSFYNEPTVYIRFRMTSNSTNVFDGVYIDNVDVSCIDIGNISTYGFKSGTSMAAPHVAGLAALILSRNDSLSVTELKGLILNYGDTIPALSGKTTSGKRINAFTSLSNTPLSQKQTQSISFAKLADKTYGDADFSLSASADSGLNVSFTTNTTSVCTVNTTTVSIISTGTCSIRASQAGNINYQAATDVVQSFNVFQASISSFISSPISGFTGDSTTLSASASPSTSPVIYASITSGICVVSGTTVTLLATGTCTITANQAGDQNYAASPQQTLNIIVSDANESYIETGLGHTCFKNKNNEIQCWGR